MDLIKDFDVHGAIAPQGTGSIKDRLSGDDKKGCLKKVPLYVPRLVFGPTLHV